MSEIVLDISANTHKNSIKYCKEMIDAVAEIDTKKHTIVFKFQLFEKSSINIVQDRLVFAKALEYARSRGYKTTASVFDLGSLTYLMQFEIEFVKIACDPKYHWLVREIPRKHMVYCSVSKEWWDQEEKLRQMCCVPEYPAKKEKYKENFTNINLSMAISDHTVGLDLWHEYKPLHYECHFVLHKNKPDNPDSGPFSKDIDELRTIL